MEYPMISRLGATCAVALAFAAVDLTVKAVVTTTAWDYHQRSQAWSTLALVLLAVVLAVGLLPSRLVAASAGVVAGGVLGNVVSAAAHGGRVANPIVTGTIALN